MKVRYTFRFYPTQAQTITLARVFGSCRFVYNWALRLRTDFWFQEQKRIGYHESSSLLTALKKQPETKWLNEVSSVPIQQSLRHLQTSFQNFWRKTSKYPTFKKRRNKQTAEYTTNAFKWDLVNKNLRISGLGRINVRWSRKFQSNPTTITIAKSPSGKYFVTLCLDEVVVPLPKTGQRIGIDLGITSLATLSNGEKIANPKYLGRYLTKLTRAQRQFSKKKKGSNRRKRAAIKVAKIQEHIVNLRKDYLNKTTTSLVKRFDVIQIEDLHIRGMVKNHKLARAISDAEMGMFRKMLTYKCEWYEKNLRTVDRFFPGSKRCFDCGYIAETLPLSTRTWICPACGKEHDRDINAAKNIEFAEGHSVKARGESVRPARTSARKGPVRRSANQPRTVMQHV